MILAAVLLTPLLLPQAPRTPIGFQPIAVREIYRMGPHDWEKDETYAVSRQGDFIRVETSAAAAERARAEQKRTPQQPPKVKVKLANATGHWSPGIGAEVSDGWIHGWDAGEFGGALYWFSKNGDQQRKIDGSNTHMVVSHGGRVYAIQALDHLMFSYARLVEVLRTDTGWTTKLVTDLHNSPTHVIWDQIRFLAVMDKYVTTLEVDGRQRELYRAPRSLMADGFVKLPNGELWMGCSRAVLCLMPTEVGNYKPFWYKPISKSKPQRPQRLKSSLANG